MADALSRLETLATAYQYLDGAKSVLDNVQTVRAVAKSNPHDLTAAKKALGLATDKYKPLKAFLSGAQTEALAAANEGFPPIPNPADETRKKMEKISKAKGPNGPGFEKELNAYIKKLTQYEYDLRERLSYMTLVKKKCDLNIKNFTTIGQVISSTMLALKAIFVSVPEAQTAAGGEILAIMRAGIEKHPTAVANAYKKLKKAAEDHEKTIAREHAYAKAALKSAADKKLKLLMEDATAFFKKLF